MLVTGLTSLYINRPHDVMQITWHVTIITDEIKSDETGRDFEDLLVSVEICCPSTGLFPTTVTTVSEAAAVGEYSEHFR